MQNTGQSFYIAPTSSAEVDGRIEISMSFKETSLLPWEDIAVIYWDPSKIILNYFSYIIIKLYSVQCIQIINDKISKTWKSIQSKNGAIKNTKEISCIIW